MNRFRSRSRSRIVAGYSSGSTGVCAPWIPPVFVNRETGDDLENAMSQPEAATTGRAYGDDFSVRSTVPRPTKSKSPVHPNIVRNKTGTSWSLGAAKYVSSSKNAKTGAVDVTWVSIEATCVDCSFKEAGVCYAMRGSAANTVRALDETAVRKKITADEAAIEEAACIDSSYEGMEVPKGRFMRVHGSGDTSTRPGAQAISNAITRWYGRGGGVAYTYTHAWRRVPRSDFGRLSVLASLNPGDDARDALRAGYKSVTALFDVEIWSENMLLLPGGQLSFKILRPSDGLPPDWHWLPCPAQYPVDKIDVIATIGGTKKFKPKGKPSYSKTFERSDVIKWQSREGIRAKSLFLAKRLDMQYEEVLNALESTPYSPLNGQPIAERSKKLMALAPYIERVGLPRPGTPAFALMFRAIGSKEKATCDKCRRCYFDGEQARRKEAIAFRPDLSGGVEKTEDLIHEETLLRKINERRLTEAAAE